MTGLPCSVIVPTYNRATGLKRLLGALAEQDVGTHNFEVIVVDDGSTDETWRILTEIETPYLLRPLHQRNHGPAAARNAAIRVAEGEIMVMVDDDVVPAPDLLRRHIEAHRGESDIAVSGVMALPDEVSLSPWAEWESVVLHKQYDSMLRGDWAPTPRQFYTANASARRDDLLRAGLFDPLFRRAEDVELAYRLRDQGINVRFAPEAVVYHEPGRSYAAWRRMAAQYGYYDIVMWREKGRAHIIRVIGHEFTNQRRRSLQAAARFLVGRRKLLAAFAGLAGLAARAASSLGARSGARSAYSAIFNLLYWQGVSDALGGRDAFLASLELWRLPEPEPEPGPLLTTGEER